MKTISFAVIILWLPLAVAQSLSQSFPAGKGSSFKVKMRKDTEPIFLSIFVASTRVDSVNMEYFMETRGLVSVQMWQQFEIGVTNQSKVKKGFVLTKEMKKPQIMPEEYLGGAAGGIQVNDFLFKDKAQLDKFKVGEETIEIAAGTTRATHYRTTGNGQTVDYWVSAEAKPIGLVLLTSKSEKVESQNYSLELTGLIDNVKAKIIPEEAGPITEEGKRYLARPGSVR